MPSGKREAAQFHYLSALAAAQPEEIRQRRTAAEETYGLVRSRLGAEGTYDLGPQGAQTYQAAVQPGAGPQVGEGVKQAGVTEGGPFAAEKITEGAAGKIDPRYSRKGGLQTVRKLDPSAAAAQVGASLEGRMASFMTRQAADLLQRKGPLWDDLVRNQQLPIIEGAAAMQRETAENLRRAAARGGAARRTAFETIQKINAQRAINTQKMQALAAHRVELDRFAIENARQQLNFNQGWAANVGGVRESYNQAMDNAAALMSQSALPVMFASKQEAAKWRYYAHDKKRKKLGGIISGALGLAGMAFGGAGALGMGPLAGTGFSGSLFGGGLQMAQAAAGGVRPPTG